MRGIPWFCLWLACGLKSTLVDTLIRLSTHRKTEENSRSRQTRLVCASSVAIVAIYDAASLPHEIQRSGVFYDFPSVAVTEPVAGFVVVVGRRVDRRVYMRRVFTFALRLFILDL